METFVDLQGVQGTKCVIVDKDFKEIRAIRDHFPPETAIQLCKFNVEKSLKNAVAQSKDVVDKERLKSS